MSSHIVNKITIDRILSQAAKSLHTGAYSDIFGYDLTNTEELNKLGSALLNMNITAYNLRYNDSVYEYPAYSFRQVPASKIQTLKSARCLRYQCDQGTIPQTETYKKLAKFVSHLACLIIEYTAAYEAAEWG